jgi:uncharacterized protein
MTLHLFSVKGIQSENSFPMPIALVIMAKMPQAGEVKTRLCPPLTPQEAATLYEAFLLDKIAQVRTLLDITPVIAYTPDTAREFFTAAAPGFLCMPQRGPDLSTRLMTCFSELFAMAYTGVIVTDSDSPTLPAAFLQQAATLLSTPQNDVVLGPSEDGGYYLLGLRALHRELLENMPWSTAVVAQETRQRALAKALHVAALPAWFDIDIYEDVQRLYASLQHTDHTTAHHTRGWFARRPAPPVLR